MLPLSIQDAAEKLADDSLPADDIRQVLHALGFRANAPDLVNVLRLASEILPTIEIVRPELPGFWPVIERFRQAPELYLRASTTFAPVIPNGSQVEASSPSRVRRQRPFSNLHGHLGKLLNCYQDRQDSADGTEAINILLCLFWLLTNIRIDDAVWPNKNWLLSVGYKINFDILFFIGAVTEQEYLRNTSNPAIKLSGLGLFGWLEKLDEQYSLEKGFGLGSGKPSPFREIISRLEAANDPSNQDKFSTPPLVPKDHISAAKIGSYIEFTERYLSRNHWYYPTPTEIVRLRELFQQEGKSSNEHQIESTILLIALVTCRTIEEALQLDIAFETKYDRPQNTGLRFRLVSAHNGDKWRLAWVIPKTQFSPDDLIISIPERLTAALRRCVELKSCGRLMDLLPDTRIDWKTRIEAFGEAALGCKTYRLNQILRDSVLRAAYAHSSNCALLTILGSHRITSDNTSRSERFALSHYLDPLGKRTFSTYQAACAQLLGSFGTNDKAQTNCYHEGEYKLTIAHHIQIAEKYRDSIPRSVTKLDQVRDCHNAFARYSLLLLLAATGHRRSKTPIYFPWDISLEDMLLFISDKIIVGSEARFVPLANVAVQQIRHYLNHLANLRPQIRGQYPDVARHIDSLIRIGENDPNALTSTNTAPIPTAGLFFTIDETGICQTLTTRLLDKQLENDGFERACRLFRPALADALWNAGHSGIEVAALLGHSNDLHPFGPASNWSVVDWADRIRPSIQDYLEKRGWQSIESPMAKGHHVVAPAFPQVDPGNHGYEGRYREKQLASARARQAIRSVISDEMLNDKEFVIDDDAVTSIRLRLEHMLANDPDAKQQALRCLATHIKELRDRGNRVTTTKTNWWNGDPSPVELTFSRHMVIASAIRKTWFQRVGFPIGGPLDEVERAAQMAISLVVAEGILNPTTVIAATNAAMEQCDSFPSVLSIRTDITDDRSNYEFVHLADTVVAAQILGLQRTKTDQPPTWNVIEKRIGLQLNKILGRKAKGLWKIKDLCLLFRPWWFIRMPGPIYAISVGNYHGPAANESSDASLFGLNEPLAQPLPARQLTTYISPTNKSVLQKEVIGCLKTLRSKAAGRFDEGTQTNRSQRRRLRKLLSTELDPKLAEHMRERPIIEAVVNFLGYLHDQGGVRGKLRYNSINTYLGLISETLIIEGWDADFEIWEENDFKEFYKKILEKCADYRAPMLVRQFHQLLRDTLGSPYIHFKGGNSNDVKSRCRSTLMTRSAVAKTYEVISTNPAVSSEWKRPAAALLSLSDGYGLRPKESLGIFVDWFDNCEDRHLVIRRNIIRDLKRKASRRVLPTYLHGTVMRPLKAQITTAAISPERNCYLFGTPDRSAKLISTSAVRSNLVRALRAASGNSKAVIYDLRHTYATRLALAALPAPVNLPATTQARSRIGRLGDTELDEVRQITRKHSGNPFLIDAIGQLLGHASVNTLLDTYFHGAHLVHAEYVNTANSECPLGDQQLANMLGVERSAVTHLRSRLKAKLPDAAASSNVSIDELIRHYLNKSERASQISDNRKQRAIKTVPEHRAFEWATLDRLFCKRKCEVWSLVDLESMAVNECMQDQTKVQSALVCYRDQIISQCGFDDFEPDQSEFTQGKAPRSRGLTKAQKERQDRIKIAQDLYRTNECFREALHIACFAWVSYVDGDDAYFIARTEHEYSAVIQVLLRLGATQDQFDIRYAGQFGTPLLALAAKDSTVTHVTGLRFSRGPRRIPVTEIAISIRQKAGSRIGEGRDVHRLFAMLTCCINGDIRAQDRQVKVE